MWDLYRDEMEEWAEKSREARQAQAQERAKGEWRRGTVVAEATSMDDDGGGSETNWAEGEGEGDLFEDIPVGIREFMRTEKKLKMMQREQEKQKAAA